MRSSNNGQDWHISYESFGSDIYDIDVMRFVDEQTGWALDKDNQIIFYTTDRGHSWETRNTPTFYVRDLLAIDQNEAWIATGSHTVCHTTDAGQTWTNIRADSGASFLGGIYFLDQNHGWAAGVDGTSGIFQYGTVFSTTDGGQSWTKLYTNPEYGSGVGEVFFADADHGWIGGTDALIMATTDGGQNWTTQYQQKNSNYAILDIHFYDILNGIAAGTDGLVLTTDDGGQNWIERDSRTDRWIMDIFPANSNTIWGCGINGTLIRSEDRGVTWIQESSSVTDASLYCITFSDELTGWAGGPGGGQLFRTGDGGKTWALADSGEHPLTLLQFLDPQNGYRIEWYGQTYRTRDGGDSWELTDVLGRDGLYQNGFFADTSQGWLCWNYLGDGYIKKTIDGAQSWQTILSTPNIWLRGIDFLNSDTGWICGGENITIQNQRGFIYKTSDGGTTWQQQVTAAEPLYDIDIVDGNIGYAIGAWGTMLKTTDGGGNWSAVSIPFSETLNEVSFVQQDAGWIVGNEGVARTYDGGQTWETFTMPERRQWLYEGAFFPNMETGWVVGGSGHILKFDGTTTGLTDDSYPDGVPVDFQLYQNYPNPFNPVTTIEFELLSASAVTLEIFNVIGQRIVGSRRAVTQPGTHKWQWNATDADGNPVASGVYFYRLKAGSQMQTRKMILMR